MSVEVDAAKDRVVRAARSLSHGYRDFADRPEGFTQSDDHVQELLNALDALDELRGGSDAKA